MAGAQSNRVEFANTLRGVAAMCVLISHYLGVFWFSPPTVALLTYVPEMPLNGQMVASLAWLHPAGFSWGAFGVALFFLISGFVIPFSLRGTSWTGFLIGRFWRIVPTYAVGFAVCLLAIAIGCFVFERPFPFDWNVLPLFIPGGRELTGWASIDGIVWTLEIEIKFYLVCAAAILLFRRPGLRVMAAPAAVAITTWGLTVGLPGIGDPTTYRLAAGVVFAGPFLLFMFVGTVLYLSHMKALRWWASTLAIAVLLVGALWLTSIGPYASNLLIYPSYGIALVVFFFVGLVGKYVPLRLGFFPDVSYPLYAVHGVAGYVVLRLLAHAGVGPWLSIALTTAGALILAWGIHTVVEGPTHDLGKRLASRVAMRSLKVERAEA